MNISSDLLAKAWEESPRVSFSFYSVWSPCVPLCHLSVREAFWRAFSPGKIEKVVKETEEFNRQFGEEQDGKFVATRRDRADPKILLRIPSYTGHPTRNMDVRVGRGLV